MDQHYTGKYFTCDREKGNATAVATDSPVTFLLVDHYYIISFHCVGRMFDVHALLVKKWSHCSSRLALYLKFSAGMPSGPGALLFFKLFGAADISSMEGIVSCSDMMGSCGSLIRYGLIHRIVLI